MGWFFLFLKAFHKLLHLGGLQHQHAAGMDLVSLQQVPGDRCKTTVTHIMGEKEK